MLVIFSSLFFSHSFNFSTLLNFGEMTLRTDHRDEVVRKDGRAMRRLEIWMGMGVQSRVDQDTHILA